MHNLSEAQSNKLMTKLSEISIQVQKNKQADGKWSLSVAANDSLSAIQFLNEQRLLRDDANIHEEKPSLLSSREDQRFRFERALSKELETTLTNIPGVLEARVHLNLPQIDPLLGRPLDKQHGSASVLLVMARDLSLKSEVATLVSGASGVPLDAIAVLSRIGIDEPKQSGPSTSQTQAPVFKPIQNTLEAIQKERALFLPLGVSSILIGAGLLFALAKTKFTFQKHPEAK